MQASLPLFVAVHAASFAVLAAVLAAFSRAQKRRKAFVQSLAVTSDDDDETMHQWALLERRQRAMRIEYLASTFVIMAASAAFVSFLPRWP